MGGGRVVAARREGRRERWAGEGSGGAASRGGGVPSSIKLGLVRDRRVAHSFVRTAWADEAAAHHRSAPAAAVTRRLIELVTVACLDEPTEAVEAAAGALQLVEGLEHLGGV